MLWQVQKKMETSLNLWKTYAQIANIFFRIEGLLVALRPFQFHQDGLASKDSTKREGIF